MARRRDIESLEDKDSGQTRDCYLVGPATAALEDGFHGSPALVGFCQQGTQQLYSFLFLL